jgi:hypothetical protein
MSAAAILRQAQGDGLELTATAAGTIKVRGPREAVAAWTPVIVENKAALLAELSSGQPNADARASVDRLLVEMERENAAHRDWFRASPYDPDGNLVMRSILTGEMTTIRLSKRRRWQ